VVSAASDNDPTNVGTAAAVGAQTGYQLSWVALLVAPLLGVVLTIAAQVGAVARDDLQSLTVKRYGRGAPANARIIYFCADRLACMSDDTTSGHEPPGAPDVVSLTAHWYAKAREQAARTGASPEFAADIAELGELSARIEALAAEPDLVPERDGSDISRRYERSADLLDLNARVAEIMARVAGEPGATVRWRRVADDQWDAAAAARRAAVAIGNAKIE
jgi:Natural resistance-associated macrophage protein